MSTAICLVSCTKTIIYYKNCFTLARGLQFHPLINAHVLRLSTKSQPPPGDTKSGTSSSSSSSDSSSSDDEETQKASPKSLKTESHVEPRKKNTEAIEKLNLLLQSMVKADPEKAKPAQVSIKTVIPKPRKKAAKLVEKVKGEKEDKEHSLSSELLTAMKAVAESIGAGAKETESELLQKLRTHSKDASMEQETETSKKAVPSTSRLSELFVGMKIDRSKTGDASDGEIESRAHQVRRILTRQGARDRREMTPDRQRPQSRMTLGDRVRSQIGYAPSKPIDLFGQEPLGVFVKQKVETQVEDSKVPVLKTWNQIYEKELRLAVTHPPANIWEEMIMWTNQGKLWKFPINNEQGLEEEAQVGFHEHVFLEQHLEPWCPKRGPVRHFMEIVCVGLSKNPYITAAKKREHIDWYKDYFEEKKPILKEVGALPE